MKNIWTILGIVLIIVLLLALLGIGMMGLGRLGAGGMMAGRFGGLGMMGAFRPLGWLVSCVVGLLVLGGVVALIFWLTRNSKSTATSATSTATPGEAPLDILKARYAKGEITKEQFDSMKQDLA